MVIHAGAKDGIVAAVLNSRVFVAIGRLSYSLYLWHWPVIVFFRNWLGHELTFMNSVQVVVLSFFFAYLSWRLIEQPARYGAVASSKLIMLGVSGGAMIAAVAFGFIVKDMGGIPQRLPKDVYALYAATYDKGPFLSEKCFTDTDGSGLQLGAIREGNLCAMGAVGDGSLNSLSGEILTQRLLRRRSAMRRFKAAYPQVCRAGILPAASRYRVWSPAFRRPVQGHQQGHHGT